MTLNQLFHRRRKNRRTSDGLMDKEETQQRQETESSVDVGSGPNNNHNIHRKSWILHPGRRRRSHKGGDLSVKPGAHDDVHDGVTTGSKTTAKKKPSPASPSSSDKTPQSVATSVSSSLSRSPLPSPVSAVVQEVQIFVDEEKDPIVQAALRHRYHCPLRGPDGECSCLKEDEKTHNSLTKAVTALDKSGNDYFAAGEYEQAMVRYERALVLKRTTLNAAEDGSGITETATAPASANSTANSSHSNAGDRKSKGGGDQRSSIMASMATSINNMTYLKQRAGLASTEETMASYLKSLQMKREILGPDHLSVGKTLNNIGSVFYLKKEYEPALSAYNDARRIMEDKLGPDHCDVGTVLSNIGDVYYAIHKKEEALAHYRGALDIRWIKLGSQDPKVIRLMKQIASLETGQQPEKDDDEVSLSENWDDDFPGDPNDSVLMASVHSLSDELKEDMKYFDLVERDMAISMVKDKMKIFQEMRELYNAENPDGGEVDEDYVMDWAKGATAAKVTSPHMSDQSDDSGTEKNASLHASQGLQVEAKEEKRSSDEDGPRTKAGAQQLGRQDATEPASALSACGEEGQPTEGKQTKTEVQDGPTESAMATAEQQHLLSESELTAASSRRGSGTNSKASGMASTSPSLSIAQRKDALVSVRNRLARLRAERSSFRKSTADGDGNEIVQVDAPPLYEMKKRSYMFPTASSAAKQVH